MNRKGIELSVTFLVGLIMGIILLSLGMVFVFKLLEGVDDIRVIGLPSYFEAEAESCVQRNELVCVPKIKAEIETTKTTSFGVVVNNIYGDTKKFKLNVDFRGGITENNVEITSVDINKWTFIDFNEVVLGNNENKIIEVPMRPPGGTLPGTYIFNVDVCFDTNDNPSVKCPSGYPSQYSPTHQISVTVT